MIGKEPSAAQVFDLTPIFKSLRKRIKEEDDLEQLERDIRSEYKRFRINYVQKWRLTEMLRRKRETTD